MFEVDLIRIENCELEETVLETAIRTSRKLIMSRSPPELSRTNSDVAGQFTLFDLIRWCNRGR